MKLNIKRINYNGKEDIHGEWWSWDEICDRCGADCGRIGWMTMTQPDEYEPDYCVKCFRELFERKTIK